MMRMLLRSTLASIAFAALFPSAASARPCRVVGQSAPAYAAIDRAVTAFMQAQNVHNSELAISKHGRLVFSHAYSCGSYQGSPTATTTVFRLASNSKAWTSAAIDQLIGRGVISRSMRAFQYLGIMRPLPLGATVDPRVYSITVGDLIAHKSGWDDRIAPHWDPTHAMRHIALALHLSHQIDRTQMVRYQLGQPLQEAPGAHYAYCNFCYVVLGMIVAKASGMSYEGYVTQDVAAPIGVHDLVVSPTLEPRLSNEVAHYYSPYIGLSAVYPLSGMHFPQPNGGDGLIREVGAPAGGLATSAASMIKLMYHYAIWGVGPPAPGWAREGSDAGTNTWAQQRTDGKNWAFLVNTRNYTTSNAFGDFTRQVNRLLNHLP
ncbi:MAG TPA: serine hydrolase domain-containing protein [Candidatus Tyrphobacter sp.]